MIAPPAAAVAGADPHIASFAAHLAAHRTATEALARWCSARHPGPAAIHARLLADSPLDPGRYTGPLRLATGERLRHRRVHLLWGEMIVSKAENWYLPDRLPAAIAEMLPTSAVPFGAAIAPLAPRRDLRASTEQEHGDFFLWIEAIVTIPDHGSIAEVHERYCRSLIE